MTSEDTLLLFDFFNINPFIKNGMNSNYGGETNLRCSFDSDEPEFIDMDDLMVSNYIIDDNKLIEDLLSKKISNFKNLSLSEKIKSIQNLILIERQELDRWLQRKNCLDNLKPLESSLNKCGFSRKTIKEKFDRQSNFVNFLENSLEIYFKKLPQGFGKNNLKNPDLEKYRESQKNELKKSIIQEQKSKNLNYLIIFLLFLLIVISAIFFVKKRFNENAKR